MCVLNQRRQRSIGNTQFVRYLRKQRRSNVSTASKRYSLVTLDQTQLHNSLHQTMMMMMKRFIQTSFLLVSFPVITCVKPLTQQKQQELTQEPGQRRHLDPDKLVQRYLEYSLYSNNDCSDRLPSCASQAAQGACAQARYLQAYCPVSCRTCHNRTVQIKMASHATTTKTKRNKKLSSYEYDNDGNELDDIDESFPKKQQQQQQQHQEIRPLTQKRMRKSRNIINAIAGDIGVPQRLEDRHPQYSIARILKRIDKARDYLHDEIYMDDRFRLVRETCRNRHPQCAAWAVAGECRLNNQFMMEQCAPVCFSCHELHYETRCPVDWNTKHAWYPGDLNRMFQRIVTSPHFQRYQPRVWSRPTYAQGDSPATANYTLGPWVVTLDHFISPQEAQSLIDAGYRIGYEISEDADDEPDDATGELGSHRSEDRTSTNAWCDQHRCQSDPNVQAILARLENLSGIHRNYSEDLQILRYYPGQFYGVHHDYIEADQHRIIGSRILTIFLYLSDVEEGGGTNFPDLDITVQPQLGRVLLWPSVLDEDPHRKDFRTDHEALPVIRGVKYGANAWLHQRKFRNAMEKGC